VVGLESAKIGVVPLEAPKVDDRLGKLAVLISAEN
jgi:hypothetical protein